MPSVLVVGAGVGGIATAGRLARAGYDVTVLEKCAEPGGRCNKIVREGHRFDVGPSLFLMPEVFAETYAALGERMEDHLDLRRVDPTYSVRFDDGLELALTADVNRMQAQLEEIEPGAFTGFLENLVEGHKHYRVSLERFVGRNFYSLFQYLSLRNLPLLFQLHALENHHHRISRYFRDPRLKSAFTFQNMYLGLSPYEAPATYSLLQYTELADGVWFPMGGMYRIVESLVEIAESNGARFIYESPVARIDLEGGRATGVVLEDGGRLAADIVVANADLPYVYESLLPDKAVAQRLQRKNYTCSTLMFYWATDVPYPQLEHHNVWLRGDYQASFARIFKDHSLPESPSFYIHVPNRTDPAAAPPGCDDLMVLVPVGHLEEGVEQDWGALQAHARKSVLDKLGEMGMRDLDEHIKFEVAYTPRDWKEMFNLAKGAAFGLGHDFFQVGYLRPQNRHRRYKNLYFTGASTHPGTGVPIVLLSARLVSERIVKEQAL
jgi:phytoene desaturase